MPSRVVRFIEKPRSLTAKPQYTEIQNEKMANAEDRVPFIIKEHDDKSTARRDEESFLSGHHHIVHQRSCLSRWSSAVFTSRSIVETILVLLLIGLLLDRQFHASQEGGKLSGQLEGNGDITGFAPRCKFFWLLS